MFCVWGNVSAHWEHISKFERMCKQVKNRKKAEIMPFLWDFWDKYFF